MYTDMYMLKNWDHGKNHIVDPSIRIIEDNHALQIKENAFLQLFSSGNMVIKNPYFGIVNKPAAHRFRELPFPSQIDSWMNILTF